MFRLAAFFLSYRKGSRRFNLCEPKSIVQRIRWPGHILEKTMHSVRSNFTNKPNNNCTI